MANTQSAEMESYAVNSYRYLRLAIVVIVATVLVSVVTERVKATCWQGSVSSYYYTPVHAVFVAALVGIGVCLIAIKGTSETEDALLNLSGMLAPIVAFIPTAASSHSCSTASVGAFPDAFLRNNIFALLIGGVMSLGLAVVIARLQHKMKLARPSKNSWIGIVLAAVLVAAGAVWYVAWRDSFLLHAHSYAAIAMFGVVGIVVVQNVLRTEGAYKWIYIACALSMGMAIAVVTVVSWFVAWRHAVLVLEVLETSAFVVFWTTQSLEHWEVGIPSGDEGRRRGSPSGLRLLLRPWSRGGGAARA